MIRKNPTPDDAVPAQNSQQGFLNPSLVWGPVICLSLVVVLGSFIGAGKIVNLIYLVGALTIGIFSYFRYPTLYIGFVWWLWFLTPLVRRLADFKSGYSDPSPALLAPFLVTLVSLTTFLRHLPVNYRHISFPFLLCVSGLAYSFLIGVVNYSPIAVTIKLLDWLVPIFFSFHLFINWRLYPSYRQNIQRVFLWGVLVIGIYGVIQYTSLPEWDRYWIIQSKMASAGTPAPFLLNVHSTLNDRGTCAIYMMAGLLLLSNNQNVLSLPATAFGYLTLLLTTVRTALIGLLFGFLSTVTSLKPRLQMRLIAILLIAAMCVIPLATREPFASRINDRLSTFSNLEEDASFKGRTGIYSHLLDDALNNVIGNGIGSGTGDSGILTILLQLGWLGAIPYMTGILLLLGNLFNNNPVRSDQFAGAARSLAVATFLMLPVGNLFDGPDGMIFWGFLGIGSAARMYNHHSKR